MNKGNSNKKFYGTNFIKIKPTITMKNSLTLPVLPPVTLLKFSENQTVKTRVLSELAAFKLKVDKKSYSTSKFSLHGPDKSDQSLYATLGLLNNSTSRTLPTDLSKLREILTNVPGHETFSLGNPATREDTEELASWLDLMLKKTLSDKNNDIQALFETAMLIYEVCFHEIVRQVSVQCVQRGDLINRVWKAYLGILEKALKISQALQQFQQVEYKEISQKILEKHLIELEKFEKENSEITENLNRCSRIIKTKEDEILHLATKEVRLIEKMQIIQKQYEQNKHDLVYLQEENRILKAKLLTANVEFVENSRGIIQPRLVNVGKIRRKSKFEMQYIIDPDPLLSAQLISNEKSENLKESLKIYEKFMKDMMNRQDFQDAASGTEVGLAEVEVQTEETEVKVAEDGRGNDPEFQYLNLRIENIMDLSEEISEIKELETVCENNEAKLDPELYLLKFQEKIDQVNSLLERMKQNIQSKIPASYQHSLLNSLYSSVADSINSMKQSHENTEDVVVFNTRGAKKLTFIQRSQSPKKQVFDQIGSLRQKIINTPPHKLKNIVIRKMLLKNIGSFYEAKMKKVSENDRKQDMSQLIAEIYVNKYGIQKVVENKLGQLMASCIKYKTFRRVRVFAKFLKLIDEVSIEDLNFYIDSLIFIKQTCYTEEYDEVKVPYDRVLDWQKSFLSGVFPDSDRLKIKKYIENYKIFDQTTKTFSLEFDLIIEYTIDLLKKNRLETQEFLKSIYEAGDVIFT